MNNYIKCNQDRWNNVKNTYTEPVTHEKLEEMRKHPISVALTIGKKVPKEWFEKANGKKMMSPSWIFPHRNYKEMKWWLKEKA